MCLPLPDSSAPLPAPAPVAPVRAGALDDGVLLLLAELAGALSAVLDLAGLQDLLARRLRWLLDFDVCTLAVRRDPDNETYDLLDCSVARAAHRPPPQTLPLATGWPGRVLTEGKPHFIPDVAALPVAVAPPADAAMGVGAASRSLLLLPLVAGERVIGSLHLGSATPHVYSVHLRTLVSLLGAQLGAQLGSILAHERTTRALRTLQVVHQRAHAWEDAAARLLELQRAQEQAHALEDRLAHTATHDALTGLLERLPFTAHLVRLLDESRRTGVAHALCQLDVDHLGVINESWGTAGGDTALQRLAGLLRAQAGQRGVAARLAGDTFALVLERCSTDAAAALIQQLCATLATVTDDGEGLSLTVSVGIAAITPAATDLAAVQDAAETACAVAKALGRGRVQIYRADDPVMARQRQERRWVHRILDAIANDRFCLYAQRIAPTDDGQMPGVCREILIRMHGPDGGMVPPGAFIPAAERYGLMRDIDGWVVRTALATIARLRRARPETCDDRYFLNLSGATWNDADLPALLTDLCTAHAVPPRVLCLEITESVAITQPERAVALMHDLRARGFHLALDDFGSGFSSFTALRQFPVEYLKIDGALVRNIARDATDHALLEGVARIGTALGLATIAEFVEDPATIAAVRGLGIGYMQGYGIERPRPLGDG